MSGAFRRFQNAFKRNRGTSEVAPDYAYDERGPARNSTRPKSQQAYESDASDEIGNINNPGYDSPLPKNRAGQPRSPTESIRTPSLSRSPQPTPRASDLGRTVNNNRSPLPNTTPNQTIPSAAPTGLPFQAQIGDPSSRLPLNPIAPPNLTIPTPQGDAAPSIIPPLSNPNGSSLLNGGMFLNPNETRLPFPVNPRSTLVGFPSRMNQRPPMPLPPLSRPFRSRFSSFRPRSNVPPVEVDYPMSDVLVDDDIPSSIAMRVNDAVEYDRFGNAYRRHRYIYEPTTQHMSLGHHQHIQRRLLSNPPRQSVRRIREISKPRYECYYEEDPLPIQETFTYPTPVLFTNPVCYSPWTTPVYHYTARAAPNDPMRIY